MDVPRTRRRLSAAVFVLICAPCFVGFLVFIAPALAAGVVGSVLLQSALAGVVTGAAALAYLVRRRRNLRRAEAAAVPVAANPNPSQR